MPTEKELLKKLTDSLNKQPENNYQEQPDTKPQDSTIKPEETGVIPLRSLADIMKEQNTKTKAQ